MKRPLLALLWASLLVIAVGCSSTKTPARIAYTTLDSIGEAADKAGPAWGDWVNARNAAADKLEKEARAANPVDEEKLGKALEIRDSVLRAEGKVEPAFYKYQKAYNAAVQIGASSASSGEGYQSAVQAASTALAELTKILGELQTN